MSEEIKAVEIEEKKIHVLPHRKASVRICKNCGRFYVLSDKDAMYYITNFNQLPLRCERCRERSRAYREEHEASTETASE